MYEFEKSPGRITQQISKLLGKKLERKFKEHHFNVSGLQWTIIALLKKFGDSSQKDIGDFLLMDKVTVNRAVDHLEKNGWVNRLPSETDRRSNIVKLSEQGAGLYLQLAKDAEEVIEMALSNLSMYEREQLFLLLDKVYNNLKDK